MPRVNGDEVKQIIGTELTASQIDPFISVASVLAGNISGLGADTMKEIERWLAAHFVAIRDPRLKSTETGDAKDEYLGVVGKGLEATQYGQQALFLDTTNALASIGKRKIIFKAL